MENQFQLGSKVEYLGGIFTIEQISTKGDVLHLVDDENNHLIVRTDVISQIKSTPKKHWWIRFRNVSWRIFVIMFTAYILFQLIRINL